MTQLPPLAAMLIGAFVRWAVTAGGATLAAHGYLDAAGQEALLQQATGFALVVGTLAWTAYQKRSIKRKVDGK